MSNFSDQSRQVLDPTMGCNSCRAPDIQSGLCDLAKRNSRMLLEVRRIVGSLIETIDGVSVETKEQEAAPCCLREEIEMQQILLNMVFEQLNGLQTVLRGQKNEA